MAKKAVAKKGRELVGKETGKMAVRVAVIKETVKKIKLKVKMGGERVRVNQMNNSKADSRSPAQRKRIITNWGML